MTEAVFIEFNHPEWERMWDQVSQTGDYDELCPDCGEGWQYMGTYRLGSRWAHQFRHRHRPTTGRREVINVAPSAHWRPHMTLRETVKMFIAVKEWREMLLFFSPLRRIRGQWFLFLPHWHGGHFSMRSVNRARRF